MCTQLLPMQSVRSVSAFAAHGAEMATPAAKAAAANVLVGTISRIFMALLLSKKPSHPWMVRFTNPGRHGLAPVIEVFKRSACGPSFPTCPNCNGRGTCGDGTRPATRSMASDGALQKRRRIYLQRQIRRRSKYELARGGASARGRGDRTHAQVSC